jgi:hypothetical protein
MAVWDRDAVIIAALVGSKFYSLSIVRDTYKERRMLTAVDNLVGAVLSGGPRPAEVETKVSKIIIGAS